MRKYWFLFILIIGLGTQVHAQYEGLSEGEIYMQNLKKNGGDTLLLEEEIIEVEELFTHLSLEEVKQKAKVERKPYYIDFTADWCMPCKLMAKTTFKDYNVVKYSHQNYYAVRLDMSDFDAIEMQAKYKITSLPAILFFDPEGNLLGRSTGLQTGTLFLKKLKEFNPSL